MKETHDCKLSTMCTPTEYILAARIAKKLGLTGYSAVLRYALHRLIEEYYKELSQEDRKELAKELANFGA